jgi:hypothetical protein
MEWCRSSSRTVLEFSVPTSKKTPQFFVTEITRYRNQPPFVLELKNKIPPANKEWIRNEAGGIKVPIALLHKVKLFILPYVI